MIGLQFTRPPVISNQSVFDPINASTTQATNIAMGQTGLKHGLGWASMDPTAHAGDSDGKLGLLFQIGNESVSTQHKCGAVFGGSTGYSLMYSTLTHGALSPPIMDFYGLYVVLLDAYFSGSNLVLSHQNTDSSLRFAQYNLTVWAWS